MLPPDGVLGIRLVGDESVEIDFNPDELSDAQVERYARNLVPERFDKCLYRLNGRACEACAIKLERKVEGIEGVRRASATFVGGEISISFDGGKNSGDQLLDQVKARGAPVAPWGEAVPVSDKIEVLFTIITLLAMLTLLA